MDSAAEYRVYQFFVGGQCEPAGDEMEPKAAVKHAMLLTHTLGARIGSTCRIIITDRDQKTVWEWRYGEGIIFPPQPRSC